MQSNKHNNTYKKQCQALKGLFNLNAHLIRCNPDKTPVSGYSWKRKASLKALIKHLKSGNPIGIVPASVAHSVLDLDGGALLNLIEKYAPSFAIPSLNPDHYHLWYQDSESRPNSRFFVDDCTGDVRSGNGYVIIWDIVSLYENLQQNNSSVFPEDIINNQTYFSVAGTITSGVALEKWSEMVNGDGRNNALFRTVIDWGKNIEKAFNYDMWIKKVAEYAQRMNSNFKEPMSLRETGRIINSAGKWLWSYKGYSKFRHDKAAQRWHQYKQAASRRVKNRKRDQTILQLRVTGLTLREIAKEVGITFQRVSEICREGIITKWKEDRLEAKERSIFYRATIDYYKNPTSGGIHPDTTPLHNERQSGQGVEWELESLDIVPRFCDSSCVSSAKLLLCI